MQMGAFVTDVAELQNDVLGEAALYMAIPLPRAGGLVVAIDDMLIRQRNRGAGSDGQNGRERLFNGAGGADNVQVCQGFADCIRVVAANPLGFPEIVAVVEDSISCARRGLVVQAVGEADTRSQVIVTWIDYSAAGERARACDPVLSRPTVLPRVGGQ